MAFLYKNGNLIYVLPERNIYKWEITDEERNEGEWIMLDSYGNIIYDLQDLFKENPYVTVFDIHI